jgi:hypothetical protein
MSGDAVYLDEAFALTAPMIGALLPTMAVLAAAATGTSEFTGIERGRLKESNRVGALREGLERMGVRVIEEKDRLDAWSHSWVSRISLFYERVLPLSLNCSAASFQTFPNFQEPINVMEKPAFGEV